MLCPEDELRVLCLRWLNDGGAYKERLWDIYYAVANQPPDFDWDQCRDSVSATGRRWIVTAIAITRKYLSLEVEGLRFSVDPDHAVEIAYFDRGSIDPKTLVMGGWKGQAVMVPAHSHTGKTTLVAELIQNGAEYYSDEYASLDRSGFVHPFPRDLSIRGFENAEPGIDVLPNISVERSAGNRFEWAQFCLRSTGMAPNGILCN